MIINRFCYILLAFSAFFSIKTSLSAQELIIPQGHPKRIFSIAHTADENYLATSSEGIVKIWDLKSGKELKTFEALKQKNRTLVTLPNRKAIGEMTLDGLFNIIEMPSLKEVGYGGVGAFFKCESMIATNDGRFVFASGRDYDVSIRADLAVIVKIDLTTKGVKVLHKQILTGENAKVYEGFDHLQLSPDNKLLFASFLCAESVAINDAYLFDTQSSTIVKQWKSNRSSFYFVGNNQLLRPDLRQNIKGQPLIVAFEFLRIPTLEIQKTFTLPHYITVPWGNSTPYFDATANTFSFVSGNDLVQLDITQQKIVKQYTIVSPNKPIYSSVSATDVFTKSGKMIVGYDKDTEVGFIDVIDLKKFEKSKSLGGNAPYSAINVRRHPTKNILSMPDNGSQIRFIDLSKGDLDIKTIAVGSKTSVNWSPDGKKAAFCDWSTQIMGIFDAENLSKTPLAFKFEGAKETDNLIWSSDSQYFAVGTGAEITIFNAAKLTRSRRLPANEKFSNTSDEQYMNFSKNGKYLAASVLRPEVQNPALKDTYIICYDLTTGQQHWQSRAFGSTLRQVTFTNDDKTVIVQEVQTGNYIYLDAATGQETGKMIANTNNALYSQSGSISADGSKGISASGNNIYVSDLVNKTKTAALSLNYFSPKSVCFLKNNNFVAGIYEDNAIHIFNIALKKEVARIVTFKQSSDWVVTTPDGRFDGTQGALEKMYYVKNGEIIPLNALFEKFYTPKLLSRILGEDKFEPTPVDINTLKTAPTIKMSLDNQQRNLIVDDDIPSHNSEKEQVTIKVQADCPTDMVTEISLFQNGKLVQTTRNLVVEDDNPIGVKSLTKTFTVLLNKGENLFKALAFNSQRTESQPDEMVVIYNAPKVSPPGAGGTEGGIQLHLVVIGINKYKNPKYNLNYATADATSFKEAIEKSGSGIFSKINMAFINDENATKSGIVSALEKIKTVAKPSDVFIFYYAGHGVLNEKKEFYLVPQDVTQLYGADNALTQKGLSAKELQRFSKEIKAQKQLFILDACQSAGALEQVVVARGALEEKAIAQLARATGTHWLTASGSEQFASEFTQLGHGTFTYVLLEALSGKADKGGDNKVTVKELDAYLQEQVPEVTAKYKGTPQYPSSYGYGNDFPIGVVKQ